MNLKTGRAGARGMVPAEPSQLSPHAPCRRGQDRRLCPAARAMGPLPQGLPAHSDTRSGGGWVGG